MKCLRAYEYVGWLDGCNVLSISNSTVLCLLKHPLEASESSVLYRPLPTYSTSRAEVEVAAPPPHVLSVRIVPRAIDQLVTKTEVGAPSPSPLHQQRYCYHSPHCCSSMVGFLLRLLLLSPPPRFSSPQHGHSCHYCHYHCHRQELLWWQRCGCATVPEEPPTHRDAAAALYPLQLYALYPLQ